MYDKELEHLEMDENLQVRLAEKDAYLERDKQRRAQEALIGKISSQVDRHMSGSERLTYPGKFLFGLSAAGLTGIGLTTKIITICPSSISGGIPVYKLPFIPKSLPGHVIGRMFGFIHRRSLFCI